jgi:hypothetical protein
MAKFARRRALDHGFTATVITYSSLSVPTQMHAAVLASLPASSVTTAAVPDVPLDDLPADARIETRMLTAVARAMPHLRALLADLVSERSGQGGGVVAFPADMFCAQALPIAADLGVPAYIVYLSNLMLLSLMLHLPELDGATSCEYRDLREPLRLPGCVPLRGADLLDTIQDRSNPAYALMVEMTRHFVLANGFVVNTFDGMEHDAITAFQELAGKGVCPPVYPVGPFIRPCSDDAAAQHGCLRWLGLDDDGVSVHRYGGLEHDDDPAPSASRRAPTAPRPAAVLRLSEARTARPNRRRVGGTSRRREQAERRGAGSSCGAAEGRPRPPALAAAREAGARRDGLAPLALVVGRDAAGRARRRWLPTDVPRTSSPIFSYLEMVPEMDGGWSF